MIRICYLADGQSIHTRRWCSFFTTQGFEVHLITFRPSEITDATVHFIDCGPISVEGNNRKILTKIPTIRKLVRKINPDLVHAHYATSYGIAGAFCGKRPFVVTALGSDVLVSPLQSKAYRWLLNIVFRKATWITAMSDPMKERMIELGAAKEKIDTVIFGIDPAIFCLKEDEKPSGELNIVSTRNFETVYNIEMLIEALAIVKLELPNIKVHFAGAGSRETQVKELVKTLNLQDCCTFYGRMSPEGIASLLRQSHIFVSVSSSDGNNISLNEAMACGCMNVVSDIPANRQWIVDNENGYFVPELNAGSIAKTVIKAAKQYPEKIGPMRSTNNLIISEKANWVNNMLKVKQKYYKLCGHE